MKYIERQLTNKLFKDIQPGKVVLLTGARRTGKTKLINQIALKLEENILEINGEDSVDKELFEPISKEHYRSVFSNYEYIFVDEAQKIPEIGKKLKFLVDNIDKIKVLATGSSAFELSGQFGEPLTGRKKTWHLYPFSVQEFINNEKINETQGKLAERLIYGSYPELEQIDSKKQRERHYRIAGENGVHHYKMVSSERGLKGMGYNRFCTNFRPIIE